MHANIEDSGLPAASFDLVSIQFVFHECPGEVIDNIVSGLASFASLFAFIGCFRSLSLVGCVHSFCFHLSLPRTPLLLLFRSFLPSFLPSLTAICSLLRTPLPAHTSPRCTAPHAAADRVRQAAAPGRDGAGVRQQPSQPCDPGVFAWLLAHHTPNTLSCLQLVHATLCTLAHPRTRHPAHTHPPLAPLLYLPEPAPPALHADEVHRAPL